ncbi:MAG: hypothetical protein PHC61_06455 [Chitinivibrionales bacterium]|nr:hypothetical protein [Chitinivibrionales bacterium]
MAIKNIFFFVLLFVFLSSAFADDIVIKDSARAYFITDTTGELPAILSHARRPQINAKKSIAALFSLFDSLGFFNTTLDTMTKDSIRITPGKRSIIARSSLRVVNGAAVPDSLPRLPAPQAYDRGRLAAYCRELVAYYTTHGFPFARVAISLTDSILAAGSGDKTAPFAPLIAVFNIYPDLAATFAAPLIKTVNQTSIALLRHDCAFKRGQRFDSRLLLLSRQRLLARAYISEVMTEAPRLVPPDPRDSSSREKNEVVIPLFVNDKQGLGLEGALAVSSGQTARTQLSGNATITFLNVFHHGEGATILYKGDDNYQQLAATYSQPWLLNLPLFGRLSAQINIQQQEYGQSEGAAEMLTELNPYWSTGLALKAHETTLDSAAAISSNTLYRFWGIDYILSCKGALPARNTGTSAFTLSAGTGQSIASGQSTERFQLSGVVLHQQALFSPVAILGKLVTKNFFSAEGELPDAELYRVGGFQSIRGYAENEFAFRTVCIGQLELLYYYNNAGALYIFGDGGMGSKAYLWRADAAGQKFFGYGLGIRIPNRLGIVSLEWARNISDVQSLGRLHFGISNAFSAAGTPLD